MDAHTLYKLMKPHLDVLDISEKYSLTQLIISKQPDKVTFHHRKIRPLNQAKEHLRLFCRMEMERERNSRKAL